MLRRCVVPSFGLGLAASFHVHVPQAHPVLMSATNQGSSASGVMPDLIGNHGKEGLFNWNKQVRCTERAATASYSVGLYNAMRASYNTFIYTKCLVRSTTGML